MKPASRREALMGALRGDLRLTNDDLGLEDNGAAGARDVPNGQWSMVDGQCVDPRGGKPSASGMHRLVKCPGSWLLEQACPPSEESADAAEGTLLHAHMEHGTLPEDEEQAECIRRCRAEEQKLERLVWPNVDVTGADVEREVRMWAADGAFSGQADYLAVVDGRALVIDYKFGRGEVAAADRNYQLAALAVLVWQNYGVGEVHAAILQPRVSGPALMVRYLPRDLRQAEQGLRRALEAAGEPGAKYCPGAEQCKYCRALAVCPAQLELARQVTAADFLNVKGWEMWDGAQKRRAYDVAKLAEKWARAVTARVEADLAAGVPVAGLELAAGRTSFTVTDAQGAFAALNGALGVSAAEFVACCKVGMTELHKLTHAKLKERGECSNTKDSRRRTLDLLAAVGEEKTTKGTIRSTIDH